MTGPAAADLRSAASAAQELLGRAPDFSAHVPRMDADVRRVVVHIAGCLAWYAHDLAAGPTESAGPTPQWSADIAPADLVRELGIGADVLARVVATARPADRGWHPWGVADAAGFAAMGIVEILVHTDDVADGLGLDWTPPAGPVLAALSRLFPQAPVDAPPWRALLWCTGRADLPGRDRVTDWRWHAAPLTG